MALALALYAVHRPQQPQAGAVHQHSRQGSTGLAPSVTRASLPPAPAAGKPVSPPGWLNAPDPLEPSWQFPLSASPPTRAPEEVLKQHQKGKVGREHSVSLFPGLQGGGGPKQSLGRAGTGRKALPLRSFSDLGKWEGQPAPAALWPFSRTQDSRTQRGRRRLHPGAKGVTGTRSSCPKKSRPSRELGLTVCCHKFCYLFQLLPVLPLENQTLESGSGKGLALPTPSHFSEDFICLVIYIKIIPSPVVQSAGRCRSAWVRILAPPLPRQVSVCVRVAIVCQRETIGAPAGRQEAPTQ